MKNMYKMMLLAVGLLMETASLNAQNRYTFGDGETRSTTIVASDNIEVTQIDDNMIQCSTMNKPMTDLRENAITHTLTINTERGRFPRAIYVAGDNYYNRVSNSFSEEVEEGYYDILVNGQYYDENDVKCSGFIIYDSVAVFDDITIDASFDECIYTIGIDAVDENGQLFNSPVYENSVVAPGLYHNADNQIVHESFGMPKNIMGNEGAIPLNYLGYFQETPATIISDPEDLIVMEGRTPLSYYQAYAIKASESLSGKNTFTPNVFSIGDNAYDRVGDNCARAIVTYNGEEIFNDSLYKWIIGMEYQNELPGRVTIDINNKHLIVAGVEKNNHTHIEFDFNREDVTAPTMTILQVKDENGKESIEIPQLPGSNIYFAAGDFSPHWTDEGPYGGHYDYMQYDGKPNIEAFCSLEDEGGIYWMHLFFEEDQTMFHENYGNYFNIPLGQLAGMYNNDWVSLKFILTDDAGNKMEQVLYNVFYVGHWDSLNEQTTLSHTVYPNPFTSEVKITAAQAVEGEANIAVYNVLGEQVYSKTYNCAETKEFIIDGSTWKPGVYFYSISTKDGLLQGKIVKE